MEEPLISIIIPAYNIEPYLARTLDSVLVQTHRNIEVIVVDDGSKDGTGKVMDAYAVRDTRVRAIHKENGGVTSARLRGVTEAKGDWIGFVDGDDYIEPNMYAQLLENALLHNADISHCGYQMVFPSRVDYYYNTGKMVEQSHDAGLRDLITGTFVEPGIWNKLYRRELFNDLAKNMDPTIRINEDLLMNYWLFKEAERSVYEDVCPYHYIVRAGSAANSKLNVHHLQDPLKVTKAMLEDACEELTPVILKRLARQLISTASRDAKEQPDLIRPFRKECRKELRQRLLAVLHCPDMGLKLKLMALFTAVCPRGYGLVHRIYARISGVDRKYEIS